MRPAALLRAKLLELFAAGPQRRPARLLEVACGDGRPSVVLAGCWREQFGPPPTRLVCLDREPELVAAARRRLTAAAGSAAQVLAADLYALPVAAGAFDYLVAINIFHAIDRRRFAREALRALGPDGVFLAYDRIPERVAAARLAVILDRGRLAALAGA